MLRLRKATASFVPARPKYVPYWLAVEVVTADSTLFGAMTPNLFRHGSVPASLWNIQLAIKL
jgi:hypothetical protein